MSEARADATLRAEDARMIGRLSPGALATLAQWVREGRTGQLTLNFLKGAVNSLEISERIRVGRGKAAGSGA